MKLLVTVTIVLLLSFTLSGCKEKGLSFDSFKSNQISSFESLDLIDDEYHFVYIYDEDCVECKIVKNGILDFFDNNEGIPFYLLNTKSINEFPDEITYPQLPRIYVYYQGERIEQYIGEEYLLFFMERYGTIDMLDYKHFIGHIAYSFGMTENMPDRRYMVYYYSDSCGICINVKDEIIEFLTDYDDIPFYLLDVADANDSSNIEGYRGTPTLVIFSEGVIVDAYVGSEGIRDYISKYEELDYDDFLNQHIYTYEDALNIEQDAYIIYYYLEGCPHCQAAKEDVLKWALKRGISDVYFMNGATIEQADNKPTELIVLNSGTPILVVMTNGNFADEFYSGTEAVLNYIEQLGDGEITTTHYTP